MGVVSIDTTETTWKVATETLHKNKGILHSNNKINSHEQSRLVFIQADCCSLICLISIHDEGRNSKQIYTCTTWLTQNDDHV